MRLLASFHDSEIENSVILGSRRSDSAFSVGTAVIMASVEVARAATALPDKEQLQKDIVQRATDEYAIASDSPYVARSAAQLAAGLLSVPFAHWQVVAGPVIVRHDSDIGQPIEGPLSLTLDGQAFVFKAF